MISGVSFQPNQTDPTQAAKKKTSDQGVQEAIKVLSLRLPRVVGAQAMAPSALLNAQGSGGNTRVDSVVNTVLNRMFPQGPGAPTAPMVPSPAPATGGGWGGAVGQPSPGESGTMPVSPPVRFDGVPTTPMVRDLVTPEPWRPQPEPSPPEQWQQLGTTPRFTPGDVGGGGGGAPDTSQPPPVVATPEAPPAPPDPMALMDFLWRSPPPEGSRQRGGWKVNA